MAAGVNRRANGELIAADDAASRHHGIVVDHALPGPRVTRLARRHSLSAYDALYLELAVRHGATLTTLDSALARAARAEGIRVTP